MTIKQERVPAGMRGRVFGASMALSAAASPVGILAYGFVIDGIGLEQTVVLLAVVNTALPLAMLAMPGLRSMKRPLGLPLSRASGEGVGG
jgi:hypothetical protein